MKPTVFVITSDMGYPIAVCRTLEIAVRMIGELAANALKESNPTSYRIMEVDEVQS